jgi:hypothetical protein
MHSLLTAMVLVSALAADDDREAVKADLGKVCVCLDGPWLGLWPLSGDDPDQIMLHGGRMTVVCGRRTLDAPCTITADGEGTVRLTLGGDVRLGVYRLEGAAVHVCFSRQPGKRARGFHPGPDEELWVLQRIELGK